MTVVLERAGAAFLRAFGVSLLFFVTGILNAPDKTAAVALSISALLASLAAGLRAIQVFVPQLSWKSVVAGTPGALLDAFTRAFVATFIILETGWLAAPNLSDWKAAGIAAVIGAVTAGVRAVQGLLTKTETPAPESGI